MRFYHDFQVLVERNEKTPEAFDENVPEFPPSSMRKHRAV
jgi:hypothetical protein